MGQQRKHIMKDAATAVNVLCVVRQMRQIKYEIDQL